MEFKIVTARIECLFTLRIAKNMKMSCMLFGLVRCVIKLLFRCLRIPYDKLKLHNQWLLHSLKPLSSELAFSCISSAVLENVESMLIYSFSAYF